MPVFVGITFPASTSTPDELSHAVSDILDSKKTKNVIIFNYVHLVIPWDHRRLRPNATQCGWSQLSLGKDGGEDKRLSALFGLQVRATCWGRCH